MKGEKTMYINDCVTGIQHIGIPTNDIEKTIAFYTSLGFDMALRTRNEQANEEVAFLQMKNVMIETYQNNQACEIKGAIDHIALDVDDIEKVFQIIKDGNYRLLDKDIQYLPFWSNGVRFFTIEGPNAEKLEFIQKLNAQ